MIVPVKLLQLDARVTRVHGRPYTKDTRRDRWGPTIRGEKVRNVNIIDLDTGQQFTLHIVIHNDFIFSFGNPKGQRGVWDLLVDFETVQAIPHPEDYTTRGFGILRIEGNSDKCRAELTYSPKLTENDQASLLRTAMHLAALSSIQAYTCRVANYPF